MISAFGCKVLNHLQDMGPHARCMPAAPRSQRDDATLSILPACHLFGAAGEHFSHCSHCSHCRAIVPQSDCSLQSLSCCPALCTVQLRSASRPGLGDIGRPVLRGPHPRPRNAMAFGRPAPPLPGDTTCPGVLGGAGTPSPRAFIFSAENAVCEGFLQTSMSVQ